MRLRREQQPHFWLQAALYFSYKEGGSPLPEAIPFLGLSRLTNLRRIP
jgi:hypothetical protein